MSMKQKGTMRGDPDRVIRDMEWELSRSARRGKSRTVRSVKDQQKYGKLLHNYLMPEDFQDMVDVTPLTLMVDRSTAAFPWEMAAFEQHGKAIFYGPGRQLARQFQTTLSGPPGLIAPATIERLRVLIIADPAPEAELQLPGARSYKSCRT